MIKEVPMKPKFLNDNPKIYLVAPSFGCVIEPYQTRLKASIERLKKEGAKITEGENIWKAQGKVSSNTPELRAKEIHDAFLSDADAVLSVGGGEVMCEILPYIDFELIKRNPKWFVGFSDNTNLTYTITTICDIESIYGTNAPSYYNLDYDALDTWNMLHGKKEFKGYKKWQLENNSKSPLITLNLRKRTIIKPYNYESKVTGRLIGGCLDCLANICGTKFDHTKEYINKHKDEGIIFFMECCDYTSISLRRALFQLKNAGWFDHVSMFLIGRSLNYYDKSFGVSMEESYLDMLKDFNKPILFNIDLGHLPPSMPMRSGALATVEYSKDKKNIFITYND